MDYSSSNYFFHVSNKLIVENNFKSRLACLRNFFIRCAIFPLSLVAKGWKTLLKGAGALIASLLIVLTLGSSVSLRRFFVGRVASLAQELADWVLLPLALCSRLCRLILGWAIHPKIYFNEVG